jgi:hypothetical protein
MRVSLAALLLLLFFCAGCKKTGPEGATGATGPAGPVGPAGDNGSVIYSGTTAPGISTGDVGDFYMDLTTSTLYGPKTSSGWGSGFSLMGDTGAQGPAGATGATGASGKAGTQIYAGTGAPAATLGATGDFYMDTVTHDLYGPKQTAGWGVPIALQGPAGPTGATGATGPQGPAGTANVLYTPWITPTNWTLYAGYGGQNIVEHVENIPAITNAIYQNGTVLCFGDLEDYVSTIWPSGQVGQLPITVVFKYNGAVTTDTWQTVYNVGSSTIQMYDTENNFTQYSFISSRFRWVIIPGGSSVAGSVQRQQKAGRGHTFQ